jgi:hypothetical protein
LGQALLLKTKTLHVVTASRTRLHLVTYPAGLFVGLTLGLVLRSSVEDRRTEVDMTRREARAVLLLLGVIVLALAIVVGIPWVVRTTQIGRAQKRFRDVRSGLSTLELAEGATNLTDEWFDMKECTDELLRLGYFRHETILLDARVTPEGIRGLCKELTDHTDPKDSIFYIDTMKRSVEAWGTASQLQTMKRIAAPQPPTQAPAPTPSPNGEGE